LAKHKTNTCAAGTTEYLTKKSIVLRTKMIQYSLVHPPHPSYVWNISVSS